jgi:hypothetical protein
MGAKASTTARDRAFQARRSAQTNDVGAPPNAYSTCPTASVGAQMHPSFARPRRAPSPAPGRPRGDSASRPAVSGYVRDTVLVAPKQKPRASEAFVWAGQDSNLRQTDYELRARRRAQARWGRIPCLAVSSVPLSSRQFGRRLGRRFPSPETASGPGLPPYLTSAFTRGCRTNVRRRRMSPSPSELKTGQRVFVINPALGLGVAFPGVPIPI